MYPLSAYSKGYSQCNAQGVVYGCDPLFPMMLLTPETADLGLQPKCTAEREDGYLFECDEFMPSQKATDCRR
mgnify:CR=1 FL=1